jgi:hypothetical protein
VRALFVPWARMSTPLILVRALRATSCKSVGLAFEGSNPSPATASEIGL